MKTIALFDFSGIFCRQWYARGSDDLNDARLTTVAQIRDLAAGYDHSAICIDSPKSWRRDRYPAYKANRPAKDAVMIEQLRKCQEDLAADGFAILGAEGYEADDVMATAAEAMVEDHVTIVSADKDMLQCLSICDGDNVVDILNPNTSPPTTITVATLKRDKGLTPSQIPHWLALMGDTSDNVPGVKGVGDKTACKLLGQFGDCNGVVGAAINKEGMTEKGYNAVLAADCDPDCPLSLALELVTLRTDAPIDVAPVLLPRVPNVEPMGDDDMSDDCDNCETCDCPDPEPTQPSEREPVVIEAEPVSEKPAPSVAMTLAPVEWERGLEPRSMGEAKTLAKHVLDSRMFSSYGTPQAALLVIMSGRELGIGAMASLRSFHVVEGKPTPSAQLLMGLCLRSPACKTFEIIEDSREKAVVVTQRADWKQPKTWTFDIKDADDAGLSGKSNWKKYRRDMLLNRCIARAARFTCPEVVANLYDPEELEVTS